MTLVQDPQHEANEEDYEEGGGMGRCNRNIFNVSYWIRNKV